MMFRDDPPSPSERRAGARKRVLLAGVVAYQEGAFAFNCRIADLTATGARLVMGEGETLPADFHLIAIKRQSAYPAHLVWRRDGEAGVSLGAPIDLRNLPDSKYTYLARIWASRNTANPSHRR